MRHARWLWAGVAGLLVLGLLVIPPGVTRWAFGAAEPIPIGWVGPLSPPGGYAEGKLMEDATEMATDEINHRGGVLGRPIKVYYEDTRGMPEQGRAAMERLITQDHVAGVTGEFHSSVALAEIPLAHQAGVPWIGVDVWADKITALGYPEVFRVSPTISLIDTAIVDWIIAAGFKNVAVIAENTDAALEAVNSVLPKLKEKGVNYDVVRADPNQTDFTAQITRFKSHTPPYDFFLQIFSEAGAYPLARQSYDLGFAPTDHTGAYNSGGPAVDPTFWQNVKEAGVYMATEEVGLPQKYWNPLTRAFVKEFRDRFHFDPSPQTMENYDAQWILADAIRRAGTTDGPAVIKALEQTDWVGTRGHYTFSTSHNPPWHYHQFVQAPVVLIQYDKINQSPLDAPIVWPPQYKTVNYLYKRPPAR